MASAPGMEALSLEDVQSTSQQSQQAQAPLGVDHDGLEAERSANEPVRDYLMNNVKEFRRLPELRKKGWESAEGDSHFKKQREVADKASKNNNRYFYTMMQTIAKDLNKATGALNLAGIRHPALLDMCMAPGGFAAKVLAINPRVRVRAMSLPVESGGHEVRLVNESVNVEFRDITTLAADMDIPEDDVPVDFPGPNDFLFTKVFKEDEKFDLVHCDGSVLRTHQRPEWREPREATRLTLMQLALGLEHLNSGGTMVILLHRLEHWRCFDLVRQFSKMSTVQLFKHRKSHNIRSSFYLIAKDIRADSPFAKEMVQAWKQRYKIATFGTEDEYAKMHKVTSKAAQEALEEFGEKFIAMGRNIWKIQADGLENASFMKHDPDEKKNNTDEQ